ncbi:MAG: head GIN domain-containing protein [Sphingomicrobium sp.]
MRTLIVAAAIAATVSTSACAQARGDDSGPKISRNYPVGNFTRVEVGGAFDVDVRTGTRPSVNVQGSEKLLERLTVEVKGDRLVIKTKRNRSWLGGWRSFGKGQIHITVPTLSAASLAGSGGMRIDKVQGDRFEGQVAGSGDLSVGAVTVSALKLGIAGSGTVEAAGRAGRAEYDIAGSGDVRAAGLNAQDVEVSIAGSGNVRGHATRNAKVDIAGSGDVELKGGAKCEVHKAGVGNVRCS